jgi:hypothetical protein
MKKLLVVGCSYTSGHGLDQEINDPRLWVNQLANYYDASLLNLAKSGRNNDWIFQTTAAELLRNSAYDLVIVAWSTIPRYGFEFGLELWPTWARLSPFQKHDVVIHNGMTIDAGVCREIGTQIHKYLHHDYWDLYKLVTYVNILKQMTTNIRFVNAMGPWDNQFFTRQQFSLPSDLTNYTQKLLDVENRSDEQIEALYNKIHSEYENVGSINENLWLNLYNPIRNSIQIDTVSETDNHPGYASQDAIVKHLIEQLK